MNGMEVWYDDGVKKTEEKNEKRVLPHWILEGFEKIYPPDAIKTTKKMPQKNNPNSIKAEKIDFQAKLNAYKKIKIKEHQKRKREKMILETKSR